MCSLGHAWLLVAGLSSAIALGGCSSFDGGSAPAIPAADLPRLVLQPEDLSKAFSRFDEGPLALADAPLGERSKPERFGRAGGWKARYRRRGTHATRGPLVIESRADLFEGSGGAERELGLHRDELELQARHPSALELVEVVELGEEAVALAPAPGTAPGSLVSITVAWRQSNVTGSVTANGFGGRLALSDVVGLARAQQRRIESAVRENA